jgi:hypothetical protein
MDNIESILAVRTNKIEQVLRVKEKWLRAGTTTIPNIVIADRTISSNAKLLFIVLCMHRFNKDYCYPSYELIEQETGWSKPTISRSIKELEDIGVVTVKRTGRANVIEFDFGSLDKRVDEVTKRLREHRLKAGSFQD